MPPLMRHMPPVQLPIVGSHRRRIDEDAALAVFIRLQFGHRRCRQPHHVKCSDNIDSQNSGKRVERVDTT